MSVSSLLNNQNLSLMFIGMSGVGKTQIANKFDKNQWFHYSIDYRIGTKYMAEPIIDAIKHRMVQDPYLHDLLRADAITLLGNLSINNLFLLSQYIGMLGDPSEGGLSWETFIERQRLHLQAEINAIKDVDSFQHKAQHIYGYEHFLVDSSGSICEIPIEHLSNLAKHTLIIYIKAPESLEQELIRRAQEYPKPLYYDESFLVNSLAEYQAMSTTLQTGSEKQFENLRFNPVDFTRWILPRLIGYRLPKYQQIADQLGITIPYEEIKEVDSAEAVLELCKHYAASKDG